MFCLTHHSHRPLSLAGQIWCITFFHRSDQSEHCIWQQAHSQLKSQSGTEYMYCLPYINNPCMTSGWIVKLDFYSFALYPAILDNCWLMVFSQCLASAEKYESCQTHILTLARHISLKLAQMSLVDFLIEESVCLIEKKVFDSLFIDQEKKK